MKTAWILAAVMVFAGFANAKDRYIVTFKSQQGFAAMAHHLATAESSLNLQKSLSSLNAVVLKTTQASAIASLKNHPEVAAVEAEFFIPSPKPVNGFKPNIMIQARPQAAMIEMTTQAEPLPVFFDGPKTPWGIMAVNAGAAWADSSAGANARVLVLDTGIDPEHQDLKANFEQGRNFFESSNGQVDASDFLDREGHGTHVSGTIAASFNEKTGFTGVAPRAKILMGRVCGSEGCSNIAIYEGINWGVQQKVDVISMSLGGAFPSQSHQSAVNKAEAAGVVVVAASGNGGTANVSYPAAFSTVYAVGAIDITLTKTSFSQWGPELDIVAPGAAVVSTVPRGAGRDSNVKISVAGVQRDVKSAAFSGTKLVSQPVMNTLVYAGLGKPEDFATVDVAGKFALISRGEIRFTEKVANAMAKGAVGAVIFNNAPGLMQGALSEDGTEIDFPVVMIEQTEGQALVEGLSKGGQAAAEIVISKSDYAMFDGTSMATPHVAGVVALVKSANKKLTPAQVRQILSSTALPLGPNTANEYGAGNIQADKAVAAALAL
ncbi:MAG: hypothetical protein A2622_00240 [Bdellovibrionales bacterium RIFCSPHIGHO2_01_FULL_40_29]|nr:MAG: hypothetical protein A2622_00240 [Bdellovibrionales bacterium RIFCSPHIGHO2_01_FULL_40_29]OFZ32555.1 MAG: hypothetical protein A3D17_04840 [Bdellovibrionales bacterium RIFCSPHIGHO2_02_FULL_40_15]